MRRTTIILLGFLSSLLVLSVIFILYVWQLEPKDGLVGMGSGNRFSGKLESINLSTHQVLKLVDNSDNRGEFFVGQLNVLPCTNETEKGKFYFPKELASLITSRMKGDTLIIQFDLKKKAAEALRVNRRSHLNPAIFYLYTDSVSALSLRNESGGLWVTLKGVTLPEATIYTYHSAASVDSCRIGKLNVAGAESSSIALLGSKIHTFNLDLDRLENWSINNCEINEENLTGEGNHNISLPKSECRKMTWVGKKKGATLNVSLEADKASITF